MSLAVFIVAFLVLVGISSPSFYHLSNITSLLGNMGTLGIIAMGETVVILTRGIDLSVGGIMGLSAIASGMLITNNNSPILAVSVGIVIGLLGGVINGALITGIKIPPIIATLGTMSIFFGLEFALTQGNWVNNVTLNAFGGTFLGVPAPVYYLLGVFLIIQVVLQFFPRGRYFYAVGSNAETARLLGIHSKYVEFQAYVISGILSGLAGLVTIGYLGFATPTTGETINLQAIAAAVIGGVNVFGGRGTPLGALLGSLFIAITTTALVFFHLPSIWNDAVEGALILISLMADSSIIAKGKSQRVGVS